MAPSPSLFFLLTALLVLCNLTPSIATSTSTTHRTSPLPLPSPPSNLPSQPSSLPPSSAKSRLEHSDVNLATSTSHSTSPPLPLPSQPSDELPPASPPSRVEDFAVNPQFIPFDFGSFNSRLSFPAHGGNDVASDGGNDVAASDGGNDVDSSFGDFGTSYSPLSFPAHENDVASPSTITFTEPTGINAGERFSSSDVLALLLTYGLCGFTAVLVVVLIWALCLRNRALARVIAVASVAGAGLAGINSVRAWVNNFGGVMGDAAVAPLENNVARAANPAAQGSFIRRCAQAGNHNQPLLQQDTDLEAGELHRAEEASREIEPANEEEIEPPNGEENEPPNGEENEPALDAAGGEQNQPLLGVHSKIFTPSTSHSTSPPLPLSSQPSDELPPASPLRRVEDFAIDPQSIPFDFGSFNSRLSFPAHVGNGLGGFTAVLIDVLIWALCLRAVVSVAGAGLAGINNVRAWVNNFRGVMGDAAVAPLENNVAGEANPAAQGSFIRRCAQAVPSTVGGLLALGRRAGNHNQPLLQQDTDLEAGELHRAEEASGEIEPAQVEEIETANEEEIEPPNGEENEPPNGEENEPALDAAGGEQNQPLLVVR